LPSKQGFPINEFTPRTQQWHIFYPFIC